MAKRYDGQEPSLYHEKRIYDGFPDRADQQLMREFHGAADWNKRAVIASQLQDERLKHFAYRIVYAERPDVLRPQHRRQIDGWVAKRVLGEDTDAPWTSIPQAVQEADDLLNDAVVDEMSLMTEVKIFLENMERRMAARERL